MKVLELLKRKTYCLKHNLCFVSFEELNDKSQLIKHSDLGMVSVNKQYIKY